MKALATAKEKDIQLLQSEKEKDIQLLQSEKEKDIQRLQSEKDKAIFQLQADQSKEILAAKTDALTVTTEMNTALREKLASPMTLICVPGSVSRRETWEKVKKADGTVMDSAVPVCYDKSITEKAVASVVKRKYDSEAEMYVPVTKCVAKLLTLPRTSTHPGTKVVDTHGRFYLDGQAPDITITVKDVDFVDSASVMAIIELKPPSAVPLGAECFGQVYDYLRKLSLAQPNRRKIVGMLSNLTQNHIIIHESPHPGVVRVCHYETTGFAKCLRFLKHLMLHDDATLPSIPSFSADLGVLEARLGSPVFSVIGVFSYSTKIISPSRWLSPRQITPGDKIVVKRTSFAPPRVLRPSLAKSLIAVRSPLKPSPRPVAEEIKILATIADAGGFKHIPELVYYSLDYNEFAMTPRGYSLDLHTLKQTEARSILREILSAIQWLHGKRIIHRDIRWDNIVVPAAGHAVLIDFGAAVLDDGSLRDYEGGIVCAPTRVIGDPDRCYQPSPADDCAAWVLLINALLTPMRWAGMRSEEIMFKGTRERERIQGLWRTLETSGVWGPGVAAAKAREYEVMLGMLELVVLL